MEVKESSFQFCPKLWLTSKRKSCFYFQFFQIPFHKPKSVLLLTLGRKKKRSRFLASSNLICHSLFPYPAIQKVSSLNFIINFGWWRKINFYSEFFHYWWTRKMFAFHLKFRWTNEWRKSSYPDSSSPSSLFCLTVTKWRKHDRFFASILPSIWTVELGKVLFLI